MGISYDEMIDLSWHEFTYYSAGYQRRLERELNNTRIMVSSMANMWGKKRVTPRDIIQLSIDDVEYEKELMTKDQANEMLNKFNECNK